MKDDDLVYALAYQFSDTDIRAAMVVLIVAAIAFVRRVRPAWFDALPDRVKFAPALVLGVALEALRAGMSGADLVSAIANALEPGTVLGGLAIAGAHTAKRVLPKSIKTTIVGIALISTGCVGSFEGSRIRIGDSPRHRAHCYNLDSAHRHWGATSKGASVVAGGLGAIPVATDQSRDAEIAIAASALAVGAFAALSTFEAQSAAETYAKDCR